MIEVIINNKFTSSFYGSLETAELIKCLLIRAAILTESQPQDKPHLPPNEEATQIVSAEIFRELTRK